MHTSRSSALNADINVTPLVDFCLVLLIIFMVVLPTIVIGVQVQLPAGWVDVTLVGERVD